MKTILLLLCMLQVFSGNNEIKIADPKSTVFKGYCTNDKAAWKEGIAAMEEAWKAHPEEGKYLFDLIQSKYGYLGFLLSIEEENVDGEIDRLIRQAERLRRFDDYRSHGEAFRGALLAIKIGSSPLRPLALGPKSEKALKTALELAPDNPQAWVEMGNLRYHAPGIFGGSAKKAITCFEKAVSLYDQYPDLRTNTWQYLHALCWMGLAYEQEDDYKSAKVCYEKALDFAPDFFWAKEELLPDVERKLK
jgi:tetratricopeptide (TPR) repeat protein